MLPGGGDGDPDGYLAMDIPANSSGNLSPRAGSEAGEDMMQDFIRLHMMSILQPFAERTHELQTLVHQLTGDLSQVREIADKNESNIDDHTRQLSALHDGAAHTCKNVEAAQAELTAAKRERNRLEGNHEMTKASVGKARERIESVSASFLTLQESLQASCERITKLEVSLPDSEKRIVDEMESRLNRQGSACKDLVKRQAEVMKACEQAKSLGEKANSTLKKLSTDHESQKRVDGCSLASLQDLAASLDAKLAVVDEVVQKHTERALATDREVQHLKTWTKQLKDIDQLHEKNSEVGALLESQASRMGLVEVDIEKIKEEAVNQRQLQNSELSNLEKTVSRNIADTVRWMDTQKAHVDLISSTGQRLQDLENGQCKLTTMTDVAEFEIRNLSSWQQGAAKDLVAHASALETTQVSLSQASEGIRGTADSLQGVKTELQAEQERLTKLGARVDQCYKYFNGLGKGLQETQRQILSADSSMLPPKFGGGPAMLPTLPTMPRTPRTPKGSLPTPRRQSLPKPGI